MAVVNIAKRSVTPNTWETLHTVGSGNELAILSMIIHNWDFETGRCILGVMDDILTELGTPTNLTVTPQGTAGTTTYSYAVSAINANGETLACTKVSTTTGNATLDGTNFNRLSWASVSGATGYIIYKESSGVLYFLAKVGAVTTYDDTSAVSVNTAIRSPFVNTTKISMVLAYEQLTAKISAGSDYKFFFPQNTKLVFAGDLEKISVLLCGDES